MSINSLLFPKIRRCENEKQDDRTAIGTDLEMRDGGITCFCIIDLRLRGEEGKEG